MSIKPLNKETIKLINSTQVITSIYSAVKELVENSLDAQAQNIEVNLVDNGLSLIEVKDNGIGINKEDAAYMCLPSYTSKIKDFNDLDLLSTYGFRGEGLTAICQVSDVTICTKTAEDETMTCYTFDNEGHIASSDISHGVNGTTVQMKNIFKNMPVRRNVINNKRRINQEIKAIELLLKNYAMCKPSIRFVFRINSNTNFIKPSYKTLIESIKSVLGMQLYSKLYHIKKNFGKTEIQLFVPKKTIQDNFTQIAQVGLQFVCVNDRPIKSKEIEKQINKRLSEYFTEKVTTSRKYIFCLILKVEPSMLDVNLEPNKDKVFLQNEATVLSELDSLLREYYGLQESQTQNDIENLNVNGNLSQLEKAKERDKEEEEDVPAPKKRKVDDQINKTNNVIDATVESIADEKIKKSTDEFLKTLSQPVLSDIDSDDELQKKSNEINNDKVENMEVDESESPESEKFDLGDEILKKNQMERIEDRLSQLPIVDLGDDFDWREIVYKCNKKLAEKQAAEKASEKQEVSDISWSKGQVPGLQGGVTVGISNNSNSDVNDKNQQDQSQDSELFDVSKGIDRIDEDGALTSNNTPNINEFQWEVDLKNPTKSSTKPKSTTPSTSKIKKSIVDDPNQTRIPFAGDNACLSTMGPSAFAMYCADERAKIVRQHPQFSPAEVAAELNRRWKVLSADERERYRELASQHKSKISSSSTVTPKKPKPQISDIQKEKNRKQLLNLLGNMKSNKAEVKNESMIMRTFVPWNISLPTLTNKFKKLVTKEILMEVPKTPSVVGSLNSLLWIAKFASSLYIFDISELHAQLSITGYDMSKINIEYVSSIVDKWFTEKNDMSVFHPFYDLTNKVEQNCN